MISTLSRQGGRRYPQMGGETGIPVGMLLGFGSTTPTPTAPPSQGAGGKATHGRAFPVGMRGSSQLAEEIRKWKKAHGLDIQPETEETSSTVFEPDTFVSPESEALKAKVKAYERVADDIEAKAKLALERKRKDEETMVFLVTLIASGIIK